MLFHDRAREVYAGHGREASMRYRFRARVEACTSFGRPRFRAIGELKHIAWRDEGWKGPKRETREAAPSDANRWLDEKEAQPRDRAEGYV
jgi:hypothetical protein